MLLRCPLKVCPTNPKWFGGMTCGKRKQGNTNDFKDSLRPALKSSLFPHLRLPHVQPPNQKQNCSSRKGIGWPYPRQVRLPVTLGGRILLGCGRLLYSVIWPCPRLGTRLPDSKVIQGKYWKSGQWIALNLPFVDLAVISSAAVRPRPASGYPSLLPWLISFKG